MSLTQRERLLLDLMFAPTVGPADMRALTDSLDIDRSDQNFLLLLSRLGYRHGWDLLPREMRARLKGIHRYHQAHISLKLPWLLGKVRRLNEAGIPVMLIKGLAMRAHYDPGAPRLMSDFDIAVPFDEYHRAVEVLTTEATEFVREETRHHAELHENRFILEIHRCIFKHYGERASGIWERAIPIDFHGTHVLVPDALDMLIHVMDNRSRECLEFVNPTRRIQWPYDCRRILEVASTSTAEGPSQGRPTAEAIAERARELNATYSVQHLIDALVDYVPGFLSAEEVAAAFPRTEGYERWLASGLALREASRAFRRHHYAPYGDLTPMRLARTLGRWRKKYRHYLDEPVAGVATRGFVGYICESHGAASVGELIAKFAPRTRLLGEGQSDRDRTGGRRSLTYQPGEVL